MRDSVTHSFLSENSRDPDSLVLVRRMLLTTKLRSVFLVPLDTPQRNKTPSQSGSVFYFGGR